MRARVVQICGIGAALLLVACGGTASSSRSADDTSPVLQRAAAVRPPATPLWGDVPGLRPSYARCMATQAPDVSTAGHREACASEEFEYQLERLAQLHTASEAVGGGGNSNKAGGVDGHWKAQRDATCKAAAADAEFGMAPAIHTTCLMHLTAERANAVARALERSK